MSQDSNLEHEFLELRTDGLDEKTFLGGLKFATRSKLFLIFGLTVLVTFGGMYFFVDQRLDGAFSEADSARELAQLSARIESGVARIERHEKQFMLSRDPNTAESFKRELSKISGALDALYAMPESAAIRHHLATFRDGLAQYDQQFISQVKREEALGLKDNTGISKRLEKLTKALQSSFVAAGFKNLADQVRWINLQGQETLLSGFRKGVKEIEQRYRTLTAFLESTKLPRGKKTTIVDLLKAHETDMLAMINSRFIFDAATQRLNEILGYVVPSLERLTMLAADRTAAARRTLAREHMFARYTLTGGSAAILLWLILAGLLIMRSMASPVRALSITAGLLAKGDRNAKVPARGNVDATGQLARALDNWIDDLVETDRMRQELEQTRARLEHSVRQAETDAIAAAESARSAQVADEREERAAKPESRPAVALTANRFALPRWPESQVAAGPLSSVSQQLAYFSEYVTAAANDVEHTEALIRGLSETTRQVEDLGALMFSIRDQINLLAFRSGAHSGRDLENLIPFDGDKRRSAGEPKIADKEVATRVASIREATDRADRTIQAVRLSITGVTELAQEIAATASNQALEATNKLLNQSEYLQSMLDDIISKVQPPAAPEQVTALEPPAQSKADSIESKLPTKG
ncbi:MAG: methyl-accepting chemotaxis protein [Rhodospirillales bacterium]